MDQPTAEDLLTQLERLVGSWDRVDNGVFVVDFEQTFRRVAGSLDATGPRRIA